MSNIFHKEGFSKVLAKRGIVLQEHQLRQFEEYASMLIKWNQRINLIAIADLDEIYERHFLGSILLSFDVSIQGGFCNIRAGAGFPGILLKIICLKLELTIMETLGKRVTFLNTLCDKLQLKGVTCMYKRTEVYVKDHRENFNIVSARAVVNLPLLNEFCIPLVKKQGNFLTLRGADGNEGYTLAEKAIRLLGCEMKQRDVHTLSDGSQRINFVFVKTRPTPKKYPRPLAQMKKSPL